MRDVECAGSRLPLNHHEGGHDHIADEEAAAGKDEVVVDEAQQAVGEEGLGFVEAIVTVAVGEGGEVETVAGA